MESLFIGVDIDALVFPNVDVSVLLLLLAHNLALLCQDDFGDLVMRHLAGSICQFCLAVA